jgi:CRP/FNR family transcriptional regulator, cyclic AMP receptor protein
VTGQEASFANLLDHLVGSELQGQLSADLFASATRCAADDVLFVAGDAGNGCYRVEDGLVKVTMMSRAGVERILAFLGPGAIVGVLAIIDGRPRSGISGGGA